MNSQNTRLLAQSSIRRLELLIFSSLRFVPEPVLPDLVFLIAHKAMQLALQMIPDPGEQLGAILPDV